MIDYDRSKVTLVFGGSDGTPRKEVECTPCQYEGMVVVERKVPAVMNLVDGEVAVLADAHYVQEVAEPEVVKL